MTFAGPSCDGIDMLYRDFPAPKLPIGAKVLVSDIGAYTTVSPRASTALSAPVLIWEDQAGLIAKSRKTSEADKAFESRLRRCPDSRTG